MNLNSVKAPQVCQLVRVSRRINHYSFITIITFGAAFITIITTFQYNNHQVQFSVVISFSESGMNFNCPEHLFRFYKVELNNIVYLDSQILVHFEPTCSLKKKQVFLTSHLDTILSGTPVTPAEVIQKSSNGKSLLVEVSIFLIITIN